MALAAVASELSNQEEVDCSSLSEALIRMRLDSQLTDVVLACDGGEVQAHLLVLSCRSVYFKTMFSSSFKESHTNRVKFPTVKLNIMNIILDYIYSDSPEHIIEEDFDTILEIHNLSHLLQLRRLTDHCLNLLMRSITTENVVNVWNTLLVYGKENHSSKVLEFVAENFEEIFEKDQFKDLSLFQIKNLLDYIEKNNFAIGDSFLNGIVSWLKQNKKEYVDLLFLLNYSCISVECLTQLMENEPALFAEGTHKHVFEKQILPCLKTKEQLHSLKPKKNKQVSVSKCYQFSCYCINDGGCVYNEKASLNIENFYDESKNRCITDLPFLFSNEFFIPVQYKSSFFIIGAISKNNDSHFSRQSFIFYDCETNTAYAKPSVPEHVEKPHVCVGGENLYVVETTNSNMKTVIQCFSIKDGEWKVSYCNTDKVIGCVVLMEELYLFCKKCDNSYYLYKYHTPDIPCVQVHLPIHKDNFSYDGRGLVYPTCKSIVVHENKLFIFLFCYFSEYTLCTVYNPEASQWCREKINFNMNLSFEADIQCFSSLKEDIFIYDKDRRKILSFHEKSDGCLNIVKTIDEPLKTDQKLEKHKFLKFSSLYIGE